MREICDSVLQRYYRLEEATAKLSEKERDALFARWITQLGKVTGPIRKAGLQEALGELLDIPWQWVEETESQLRAEGASDSLLEDRRRALVSSDDDSELEEWGVGSEGGGAWVHM